MDTLSYDDMQWTNLLLIGAWALLALVAVVLLASASAAAILRLA
jgi:hypothetical protein